MVFSARREDMDCRGGRRQRVVTDMASRQVVVPGYPERVLSLCTSASDTIVRLGLKDRLAAVDEFGKIVPGTGGAAVIGRGSAISREQVLNLGIDLAFVWWYQQDAAHMLEGMSVPVVKISTPDIDRTGEMIRVVGYALNAPEEARALASGVEDYLADAGSGPPGKRPSVYLELYGQYSTAGGGSYIGRLIELAGGANVAAGLTGNARFSPERLIESDPEIILFVEGFTETREIGARAGLQGVSAVREGRVFAVDRGLFTWGAGLPEAAEELRNILESAEKEVQNGFL